MHPAEETSTQTEAPPAAPPAAAPAAAAPPAPAAAPAAPAVAAQGSGKTPLPPQRPSIGRDVHYVRSNGEHAAAKITRVHNSSTVNLTVFTDTDGVQQHKSVSQLETDGDVGEAVRPHTWHWPERV